VTIEELDRLASLPKDRLRAEYPDRDFIELHRIWKARRKVLFQRRYRQEHKGEWGGGFDIAEKARRADAERGSRKLREALFRTFAKEATHVS
jgi:hypothetical protein